MSHEGFSVLDLAPGRQIADKYEIISSRRQAGLSTAFEVKALDSGDRCELQFFAASLFEAEEQVNDFRSILMPWTQVNNASVLQLREVLQLDPSTLALVSDYPQGHSLRVRLKKRKRLSTEETISIGLQVLDGLVAIHDDSLVHGDIKPATIFVDGEGADLKAILVDGGITPSLWTAKDLGERTALIGTPYYAPIEQFGGDSPTVQSDLYNLAAVLFECLSGVLPWPGKSLLEVFQAKLDKAPPSFTRMAPDVEVDPEVGERIVKGCLADRNARYASAGEFLESLQAIG